MAGVAAWCREDLGIDFWQALALVLGFSVLAGAWIQALDRRLAPGFTRLLAVLPVVAANLVLTCLFCRGTDATTVILVAFNTAWLSSFKALAWAMNRGALADALLTPVQFIATYMAPLTPRHDPPAGHKKGRLAEDAGGVWSHMLNYGAKLAVMGAAVTLLLEYPEMPGVLQSFCLTWGLYALLSSVMDGPAVLLVGLLGMKLSPHFDKPFLANSTASWWNKRWDIAAGNTLRAVVFDPICERRWVADRKVAPARPGPLLQLLASCASFGTSGLIHEGIYWYMTGHTTGGIWMCYFMAQVPLIIAERVLLAALRSAGIMLPNPFRILITLACQNQLGHWFFWPPIKGPVADQVIGNILQAHRDRMALLGLKSLI